MSENNQIVYLRWHKPISLAKKEMKYPDRKYQCFFSFIIRDVDSEAFQKFLYFRVLSEIYNVILLMQ